MLRIASRQGISVSRRPKLTLFIIYAVAIVYVAVSVYVATTVAAINDRRATQSLETRSAIHDEKIQSLEQKVNSIEAIQIERRLTKIESSQESLDRAIGILMNLGIVTIAGIIIDLGLHVFRLSVQVKTTSRTRDK